MQTTVTFETEDLLGTELPIFISLIAHPGFNMTCLESFGFTGDFEIFNGKRIYENGSTTILWGADEHELSIQSRLFSLMTKSNHKKNN